MFRQFVVLAGIFFAYTSAGKLEDFPQEYRELMPEQVKKFITGLSDQEKATMKEVYENFHTYKSDQEVVAAVKTKSPELAAKLEEFDAWIKGKAAALGPEARGYFDALHKSASQVRAQFYAGKKPTVAELKQVALEDIKKYRALSAAGKADIRKQFPILAGVLESDKFYKEVESLH
ncbi:nematode fatty acid retinoid binding protein [Ancylostoma caninum]|uniref:Nematode fatty acid retinoid binding protein n=1 Tax=Ancylostoma caninum TaxID=29170 RepID=A0A368FB44_ANCCA|nr:nematode fatty acid retinoid binding protein [Ancylostoma caninum]